eukprot:m.431821 g.431821  ORF g.431821 m.431821 type:complete len:140 (-) comp17351_c0_seq1:1119-1538(-)
MDCEREKAGSNSIFPSVSPSPSIGSGNPSAGAPTITGPGFAFDLPEALGDLDFLADDSAAAVLGGTAFVAPGGRFDFGLGGGTVVAAVGVSRRERFVAAFTGASTSATARRLRPGAGSAAAARVERVPRLGMVHTTAQD